MERAVLLQTATIIEPDHLALVAVAMPQAPIPSSPADGTLAIDLSKGIVLDELERTIIHKVLSQTGWNRTKAAQLLGLSRETLRYRIEKHNLRPPAALGEA